MGGASSKAFFRHEQSKGRVSSTHHLNSYTPVEEGKIATTDYRIKFKGKEGEAISPW